MRRDRMTPDERAARAAEIVDAEMAEQGIEPGSASPALLARTARLLSTRPVREDVAS